MKRTSEYSVQINHSVFVEYDGKTYYREQSITNGKVGSVRWTQKIKNVHGTWDEGDYVTGDLRDELNKEFEEMSYLENFKS